MGLIYMATNKVNGKSYIGQTKIKFEVRRSQHKTNMTRRKTAFNNALLKYGWNNFIWEILEDGIETSEELNEKEIYYIDKYDTYNNGYNMTYGGGAVRDNIVVDRNKYSDDFIKNIIRYICDTDLSYADIARIMEVSSNLVMDVAYKTYRENCWEGKENPRSINKKLNYNIDTIKKVIKEVEKMDKKNKDIAEMFNIPVYVVSGITAGKYYKSLWDYDSYCNNRDLFKFKMVGESHIRNLYSDELWYKIKEDIINTDIPLKELALKYDISIHAIKHFNRQSTKKYIWGDDFNPRIKTRKHIKDNLETIYIDYFIYCKDIQTISSRLNIKKGVINNFINKRHYKKEFKEFEEKYGKGVRK